MSEFIDCYFLPPGRKPGIETALNAAGFTIGSMYPHPLDGRVICAHIYGDKTKAAEAREIAEGFCQ